MAEVMKRLSFDDGSTYTAIEAAIHLNRYLLARSYCSGKKVLDIACGEGYGSYVMAESWGAAQVHGVDNSPEAIESARKNFTSQRVVYHCQDAERLGELFGSDEFDLIVSLETFEHLRNPQPVLRELNRILKPEGTVIVTCPNDHWYYRAQGVANPFHVRKYYFEEFRAVAEAELGSALYYLMGTPVAGYINLRSAVGMTARAAESPAIMLDTPVRIETLLEPTEEQVDWTNCNYFVGIWGGAEHPPPTTATVYACSLDTSQAAHRQIQVESLRDEAVMLRSEHEKTVRQLDQLRARPLELEREVRHSKLRVAALRGE